METFDNLSFWLSLAACASVAVATALLGVTLVLRRLSYMGDGLSHIAFGAMAIATACGLGGHLFLAVLPLVALAAVFLLNSRGKFAIRGDAALAMMIAASLAVGYILRQSHEEPVEHCHACEEVAAMTAEHEHVHAHAHEHAHEHAHGESCGACEVCDTLFGTGSLSSITSGEALLAIALSLAVVAFFVLFRRRIFAVSFDPEFAEVCGIRVSWWESVLAILSAVSILLAMKITGTLLVSAMVVFPAVAAMRFARSFASTLALSAVVAATTTAGGIFLAGASKWPPGATVVLVDALIFVFLSFKKPNV